MDPNKKWCSYKSKQPGLAYEIAISAPDGNLIWVNGPFPAGTHDLDIYQKPDGLMSRLPVGKKLIADTGYAKKELQMQLSIRNPLDSDDVKLFKKRVRAKHENFNALLKNFRALEDRFRHGVNNHKTVMIAGCVLVQYEINNGHPLLEL